MDLMGEFLAFFALADIFLCVGLHARPPVSLRNSSVGQRSSPNVTSAYVFMNLVQESIYVVWVYTLEVRTGEGLLV